jgi:hypothetical protein
MLGRYDRAMRARQPVGGQTLLARAIAAIRRNNGALFYVPQNFAGSWTDSAGTDPVDAVADVIGRMTDRTGGTGVATQATTANKPVVGRVPRRVGPELVTNGSFDGVTGWTIGTGWSVSGGIAAKDGADNTSIFQTVATEVGKSYLVTCRITTASVSSGLRIIVNGVTLVTSNTVGTVSAIFTATSTTTQIPFNGGSFSGGRFDDASVREALEWSNSINFDGSNDSLSINLASGGSPFVRSYTRTGTVAGFTSATTSAFVLGQPTVAGRDVCAIVCAPNAITGADLTAIERWAASIGATP